MLAAVLFDLDGTLSDGAGGMLAALAHACDALGLAVPGEATLRSFIGPPFQASFARHFGLDPAGCARAVAAYRAHYVDGGAMFDAAPYPGVAEMLERLSAAGLCLAVATSKPEAYARDVVVHLGLDGHLAGVFGADLEGRRTKGDVIGTTWRTLGLDPARTVMVGDRSHDVVGARDHEMDCVGVLWGHGSAEELEAAGAVALVATAGELAELVLERR